MSSGALPAPAFSTGRSAVSSTTALGGSRFRDFASLDDKLKELYPSYQAELPEKKALGNLDARLIASRQTGLAAYLQALLANQLVRTDPRCARLVHHFLQPTAEFRRLARPGAATVLLGTVRSNFNSIVHKVRPVRFDRAHGRC